MANKRSFDDLLAEQTQLLMAKKRQELEAGRPQFSVFDLGTKERETPAETQSALDALFSTPTEESPEERIDRLGRGIESKTEQLSFEQKPTLNTEQYLRLRQPQFVYVDKTTGQITDAPTPTSVPIPKAAAGKEALKITQKEQKPDGVPPQKPSIFETEKQKQEAREKVRKEAERPAAESSLLSVLSDMDRMKAQAEEIINNPNLGLATGLTGAISRRIPGTATFDVGEEITNLVSQTGFTVLQNLRNAAKTGGALGQVSDKENELLQKNISALDPKQSKGNLVKNLRKTIEYVEGAKQRLSGAFESTYGVKSPVKNGSSGGITSAIQEAQTAISQGAPKDKVIQRLLSEFPQSANDIIVSFK